MFKWFVIVMLLWASPLYAKEADMTDIFDISVTTIDGEQHKFEFYKNNVLLIVNVASKCGFTSQYDGLESLYRKYKSQGLMVLGFPCNQFGKQEPGIEQEIKEFCRLNYGVTFPMFSKIEVNGDGAHPLFVHLTKEHPGVEASGPIKWNFTKFLVGRDGEVKHRFPSSVEPDALADEIERLL